MRMSTSHGAGTAKVRPVNDDFEAETAEARPVTTAEAAAPEAVAAQPEKKKGGRRMMLPILGLALLAAAGWYGYQWWTYPGASFGAQGIFGQSITIVPDRRLVIASVSSWPAATGKPLGAARRTMLDKVIAASSR